MRGPFVNWKEIAVMPLSRGFYATFNAVSSAATILIGVMIGELLKSSRSSGVKCLVLLVSGAALFASGFYADKWHWQPMVKHLWNTSFALYAAGWTCWMLLFFYAVLDVVGWRGWAFPFVVVGVNSIFIYFCSGVLVPTINRLLKPFVSPFYPDLEAWGPVVMAALVVLVLWLLCWFLYRKRIFFKV
jgi:predicted acyltransferase